MPKVTFTTDDTSVDVRTGENLLRAAMMADVAVTASCGGGGTCGKCRMVVEEGTVEAAPTSKLTAEQVAAGYVLGCKAQVTGDVAVGIPPESRPGAVPARHHAERPHNVTLGAEEHLERLPAFTVTAPVRTLAVEVAPPDLSDNASDATRLAHALRRAHGLEDVTYELDALRALPAALRGGDWNVAVTVDTTEGRAHVIAVRPGADTAPDLAVAVDVGTTSIEVALLDLAEGTTLAQASEYNAQVGRGEDVINRIISAGKRGGLEELQRLAAETIGRLALRLCAEAGADPRHLASYTIAGNTVMTHLLWGIDPANIRTEPYVPAATRFPWVRASVLGLPGGPATLAGATPCPASWLGGDIVAGVVAAGIPWSERLTLFVDIGTNGEIVLGNKDWLVACSCSAGPAFEGGGILHGMRAAAGAIEQVRVDDATLEPTIATIEGAKPVGICGSGLMDAVSELFLAGAIDRGGHFAGDRAGTRLRAGDHGFEYVLASAADSGTGADVVLTEVDVENLIRAKAAIFAGISVLTESVGVETAEIAEVVIAGGFGHYLDLDRVIALGLLPEIELERFVFIGNSSLLGARLAALSGEMRDTARRVAEMMTYLELSANALFMDAYVSAMFLPHTDTSLFPQTEALLRGRSHAERAV
ncbi:MAG: ferredoxin [Coriobacteriaceae bacterium]|nr:ferredoxin [Coriobacteriaceae bacterium]